MPAQRATVFSQLVTLLDVGEKARPLIFQDPERAVRYVAPVIAELYGAELAQLTPAEWNNLELFTGELLDELRKRLRP